MINMDNSILLTVIGVGLLSYSYARYRYRRIEEKISVEVDKVNIKIIMDKCSHLEIKVKELEKTIITLQMKMLVS